MLSDAKWLCYETGAYKGREDRYGNPSPYFRKSFESKGEVKKATLLFSALGVYKLFLNGEALAGDYLSPGWVDYQQKMPLIRYDISGQLKSKNAVAVVLGDGWAIGHLAMPFKRNSYGDALEFACRIEILYADGTCDTVVSDESWRASAGEIRRSDIYLGEEVDHRFSLGDFSHPDYDDSAWDFTGLVKTVRYCKSLLLDEMKIPPIVVKHTFSPKLIEKKGNVYLYDVTQNIAGVISCVLRGERGARVTLRHAEVLENGKIHTESLRKAESTDTFILSGEGEEHFRPLFTFHGFQFVEITCEGEVEILELKAEAMYSDLKSTGSFTCSDPLVNKIYQNALWSQRDNFLNVPTDCPQRDERLGWTADAQIFCRSAIYNMDCDEFYKKYMADMRLAQLGNGIVPAIAPTFPNGYSSWRGTCPAAGWSEAIGELPMVHYEMYGDKSVVRDNLYAIKRQLDYYEASCPDHIRRGTEKNYGDWLSLSDTDKDAISTVYYARLARIAERFCAIVGDFEEERYRKLYRSIKTAFLNEFSDADGKLVSDTQSIYVISYCSGLIDLESARKHLNRKLSEDGGKLTCGFLGIKFLLPTLCDIGRSDAAYAMITSREYPGWGYSVVNGATTIWERWDSFTLENGIKSGSGMNSFNHYSLGSCTEWMYSYVLGIRPDSEHPGFERVLIAPYPNFTGKLESAKGYYDSVRGRICAEWKRADEGVEYCVTIPENMPASFDFHGLAVLRKSEENGTFRFLLSSR